MNYGEKVAATPTRKEVSRIQIKCCQEGSPCAHFRRNKQHAWLCSGRSMRREGVVISQWAWQATPGRHNSWVARTMPRARVMGLGQGLWVTMTLPLDIHMLDSVVRFLGWIPVLSLIPRLPGASVLPFLFLSFLSCKIRMIISTTWRLFFVFNLVFNQKQVTVPGTS